MLNPILPGFYPDPSVCRKDDWFYVANSSFQWWPGIPIHRSRDLQNWEYISHALTSPAQADLSRIADSSGIWAPDLTYANGLFWLVYTIVSKQNERVPANRNLLMTTEDVCGSWSEPVYLNSMGYDPSLFHEDDGRVYLVSMRVDDTPGEDAFKGIVVQEYDPENKQLIGRPVHIFSGTELGITEGPHIYKRNGWYYLLTAEGGTLYSHAATLCRSRSLYGPYELYPDSPLITANGYESVLQKAGHADMIEVEDGRWALFYLAGRPLDGKCMLGRETCLQSITWKDDWPCPDHTGPDPVVPDFSLPHSPAPPEPERDDFDVKTLPPSWQFLRVPPGKIIDLTSRPGWLRLHALPTVLCNVEPVSFTACRIRHHSFVAETLMEYHPEAEFQHAGLVCYYDTTHWYFLSVCFRQGTGHMLSLRVYDGNAKRYDTVLEEPLTDFGGLIHLGVICDGRTFQFVYRIDNEKQIDFARPQDALILSDDYIFEKQFAFTGACIGLAAWDRFDLKSYADFDWFAYAGVDKG